MAWRRNTSAVVSLSIIVIFFVFYVIISHLELALLRFTGFLNISAMACHFLANCVIFLMEFTGLSIA